MSKQRTLSLFSLSTPHGSALQQQIEHLVSNLDFKLNVPSHPTMGNIAAACFNDDVVIFDGSIEEEGHNYEIAYEQLKRLEYAFIVSRAPLPLNFLGLQPGVAPAYPHSLSNDTILRRLRQVLPMMTKRPWSEKGVLFHLNAQSRSLGWETRQRKEQSQIFISYRSRYSSQVKLLQERLHKGKFHERQPKSMAFFSPGSLAFEDEIMSAMRRWQILCIIREYIADCEEFWIYQTEDYLDSWWTRGELASLLYFGVGGRRVRAYNASSNTVRDITASELPTLSKEERNRMARWFANTDPMLMGAESTLVLGEVAHTPLGTLPFLNDAVWKEEFQYYPVMQCSSKQCNKRLQENGGTLFFDISKLLWMREDNLFVVEDQKLAQMVEEKELVHCPRCNAAYRITRESLDRYLYLALPVGKGPKGPNLQILPVYRAMAMNV